MHIGKFAIRSSFKEVTQVYFKKINALLKKPVLYLTFASVLLSVITIEIFLHSLSNGADALVCRTSDIDLHHKFIPNSKCVSKTSEWEVTYEINHLGLRDEELEPEKGSTFRILVLGDSFVEGYGVKSENRFTELLEKKLNDIYPFDINVINAGVSSYSPVLELEFLKRNFVQIKPDLVLVALDLTDFKDEIGYYNFLNETFLAHEPKNETLKIAKEYENAVGTINLKQQDIQKFKDETGWQKNEKIALGTRIKMFLRKSQLYVLITNEIKNLMNKPYLVYGSPPIIEGDIETDLFAVARENIDTTVYDSLWILPKKSLSDLSSFASANGSKVAFFTYPHGMQVDGKQWPAGRLTRGFKRGITYSPRALDDLVNFGNNIGVPSFNLLTDFYANRDKKLYFDKDGHFNDLGHRVAAKSLLNSLVSSNLIN